MHRVSLRNLSALVGTAGVILVVAALYLGGHPGAVLAQLGGPCLGIGIVGWCVDAFAVARHRRDLRTFAASTGAVYEDETYRYSGRFSRYPFGVGKALKQRDVLTGHLNEVPWATFTHHFSVGNDLLMELSDEAFQVTLVELPVALPRVEFVPENLATRLAGHLGRTDVDVESIEFNRTWRVITEDPRYAHALLTPRMVARLLEADADEVVVRIEGSALLTWQAGRADAATIARRIALLTAVARRIPRYVVQDYRVAHGGFASGWERAIPDTAPPWARMPGILTAGKATGIDPGPPAGYGNQDDESFDIFRMFRA